MNNICWLDILLLLPLLYGLIRGLMRGLITELNTLLALLLGVAGAKSWGAALASWLHQQASWPTEVCNVIAYVLLFLAIAVALHFIGTLLQKLLKAIQLGWVNRLLGGICGAVKWAVIVLALVFVVGQLDHFISFMPNELKKQSRLYQPALDAVNHTVQLYNGHDQSS